MKYALIIPNLSCGGAEKAMIRLATALEARGHTVHLILLRRGQGHEIGPGIKVHSLFDPDKPKQGGSLGKLLAVYRLRQLFNRLTVSTPFDVVISTLPYADHVVNLARLPNVWYRIANTLSEEVADLNKISRRRGEKRLQRIRSLYRGKQLIVNSEGVGRDLVEKLGVRDARIEVISNYIDVDNIKTLSSRHDPEIPAEPFIIHVGRFSPAKRHDLLLRAWKIADLPCKLVLLVKPSAKLANLIESEGVEESVIVAGFKPNPFPWIKAAKLLVLSSEREGLPNVLLEALWLNTPVISTDCRSGPREILEFDPERYLTPVNDPEALGRRIRELWDQPFVTPHEFELKYSPLLSIEKYEALGLKHTA